MYKVTIFKSTFDNITDNVISFEDWQSFVIWLNKLYRIETCKPEKGKMIRFYHAPLISPAIYTDGKTRANANVDHWSKWAILDIDHWAGNLETAFSDYDAIVYNTPSCRKNDLYFRLIIKLTREIKAKEFAAFWYALKKTFGIGDEQTKDMARMFYVPGQYPDAYSFFYTYEGKALDPDEIMLKYPIPKEASLNITDYLDDDMRQEWLSRKTKHIVWSSYKDCPFINKELIMEYKATTNTGWYHKMYQIMVSIAKRAILMDYPISSDEIAELCKELDSDTGNWYVNRPLRKEAERAIRFVLSNS